MVIEARAVIVSRIRLAELVDRDGLAEFAHVLRPLFSRLLAAEAPAPLQTGWR